MALCGAQIGVACQSVTSTPCPDEYGCPSDRCPDFVIRRHDTKPPFRVAVEDCDGALNIVEALEEQLMVLEANMWAKGKLKRSLDADFEYIQLANNIGFHQALTGDIIVMERARLPEHMLVTGFNEEHNWIRVQRGYNGTQPSTWKKGTPLRIFRQMNAPARIEATLDDVTGPDGSTVQDQLVKTMLIYEWNSNSTCMPGCFWLEFKLLKMVVEESDEVTTMSFSSPSKISNLSDVSKLSFTPSRLSSTDFGCTMGEGVEWVRRFPVQGEGFLIKIEDSPTAELMTNLDISVISNISNISVT